MIYSTAGSRSLYTAACFATNTKGIIWRSPVGILSKHRAKAILISTDASVELMKPVGDGKEEKFDGKGVYEGSMAMIGRDAYTGLPLFKRTLFVAPVLGKNAALCESMTMAEALFVAIELGYVHNKVILMNDNELSVGTIVDPNRRIPDFLQAVCEEIQTVRCQFKDLRIVEKIPHIHQSIHLLSKSEHKHYPEARKRGYVSGSEKMLKLEKSWFPSILKKYLK